MRNSISTTGGIYTTVSRNAESAHVIYPFVDQMRAIDTSISRLTTKQLLARNGIRNALVRDFGG